MPNFVASVPVADYQDDISEIELDIIEFNCAQGVEPAPQAKVKAKAKAKSRAMGKPVAKAKAKSKAMKTTSKGKH